MPLLSFFRDQRHSKSVYVVITATACCVAISSADIFIQALEQKTEDGTIINVKNFLVVAAAYLLFAVVAAIFSFSRVVTIKSAIADIPKLYVPIKEEDLPKRVYQMIQAELTRVSIIAYEAHPIIEDTDQPGWGRPGTELEGLNFRSTIIGSQQLIEQAATRLSSDLGKPPQWSIARYVSYLVDSGFLSRRLGKRYVDFYEAVRFADDDVSQFDFAEFMKLQYLVLDEMHFYDNASVTSRGNAGSSGSGRSALLDRDTDDDDDKAEADSEGD